MKLMETEMITNMWTLVGMYCMLVVTYIFKVSLFVEAGKLNRLTEADMEAAIRLWLKNAGDRDGGRKKRAQLKAGK